MTKILHIQVLPKLSGVQKVSLEILKSLPNDKYEKYILFSNSCEYGDIRKCITEFEKAGVKVLLSEKLKREICKDDINALKEIYRLCTEEKFDIVHTNSTKPGIIGRIAATFARVPYVIHTVHGLSFYDGLKFPKWQFYWACEMLASLFCDRITMVNQYYGQYFKWCKYKTTTIYNGIDFSEFPDLPLKRVEGKDGVKILFVGRLDYQKNPLMLLKVAKIVCKKYPTTQFTIVGDGEYMDECKTFIHDNELDTNVSLEGWQSDVYKYYSTHDILAIPSRYEAFGLIFIEGAYYSIPVVSTTVEGIPEVVNDGTNGLLSCSEDVESFATNILRLIEEPELRKKLGDNNHNIALNKFNVKRMVDGYIDLYKSFDNDHYQKIHD